MTFEKNLLTFSFCFFFIGIQSTQGVRPLRMIEFKEKEGEKYKMHIAVF